jgi:ABC-2 type transport system permease protein
MASNAMVTFALYPVSLFEGSAKFILFTLVPAAFMGAVPAAFVHHFSWTLLAEIFLADFILLGLALLIFRAGLRRYESGSAIPTEV